MACAQLNSAVLPPEELLLEDELLELLLEEELLELLLDEELLELLEDEDLPEDELEGFPEEPEDEAPLLPLSPPQPIRATSRAVIRPILKLYITTPG